MNKLILNFFGEEVTVDTPKSLSNLKKEISDKFFFSPSDAEEVLVSYINELKKSFIKTEQDFIDFIKKKIYKVDLDISPDSQLYKRSVLQIKEETEKDKKELDELIKKKEELKNKKKELKDQRQKEIKEIREKIKELTKKMRKLVRKTNLEKDKISNEITNTNQKIADIQKKLGLPVTEEKKIEKPKAKQKQEKKKKSTIIKKIVKKDIKKKVVKKAEKKPKQPKQPKQEKQEKDLFTKVNETINKTVENITKLVSEQLNKKTKEVEVEKKKIEDSKIQLKEEEIKGFFDFTSISKNISEEINKWTKYVVQQTNELTNTLSEKYKNCMNDITSMKKKVENIKLRAPAPKKSDKKIHKGCTCNGCQASPIVGNRFKCAVCSDFNYCEECEEKNKDLHLHPFIKIYSPEIAPLDVKCEHK